MDTFSLMKESICNAKLTYHFALQNNSGGSNMGLAPMTTYKLFRHLEAPHPLNALTK